MYNAISNILFQLNVLEKLGTVLVVYTTVMMLLPIVLDL